MPGRIPEDFAAQLAVLLAADDREAFGSILGEAVAELDDVQLADFLEALGARVRDAASPLRAAELRALLAAVQRA
jgi:hypothetical protein